jgi:hypothetical protein
MKHLYAEFEKTPLWKAVDEAISDLEKNRDMELITTRENVIGYICQQLAQKKIADKPSFAKE